MLAAARSRLAPWVGLAAIPAFGVLLHETRGAFTPWALVSIVVGVCLWALIGVGAAPHAPNERAWWLGLHLALIGELYVLVEVPLVIYAQPGVRHVTLVHALEVALHVAGVALVVLVASRGKWSLLPKLFGLFVVGLFVGRIAVIAISPNPHIDVYALGTLGAQFLLDGKDPYSQVYPDIYNGAYGYAAVFAYGPAYLLWATFNFLLGDIRFATVLAEMGLIAVMLRYMRGREREALGKGLLIVWLAIPVCFFMVEQTWIDPIVLTVIACMWIACVEERFLLAGLLAGVALGVKQTTLIAVLLTLAWVIRVNGKRGTIRFLLGTTSAAALVYVPFLVWDAEGIWRSLVTALLETPTRMDALTLRAYAGYLQMPAPEKALSLFGGGACVAAWIWLVVRARTISDLTSVTVLSYSVVFLCGFQAFCNYYWFVAGLVMVDLVVRTSGSPADARAPVVVETTVAS